MTTSRVLLQIGLSGRPPQLQSANNTKLPDNVSNSSEKIPEKMNLELTKSETEIRKLIKYPSGKKVFKNIENLIKQYITKEFQIENPFYKQPEINVLAKLDVEDNKSIQVEITVKDKETNEVVAKIEEKLDFIDKKNCWDRFKALITKCVNKIRGILEPETQPQATTNTNKMKEFPQRLNEDDGILRQFWWSWYLWGN